MNTLFLFTTLLFFSLGVQCKVLTGNLSRYKIAEPCKTELSHTTDSVLRRGESKRFVDPLAGLIHLRNENAEFKTKALRGSFFVFGIEICCTSVLLMTPEEISKWDKSEASFRKSLNTFKLAYTELPIKDNDLWAINYIGHPYQGAYFYNAVRSQNATVLQSSLFCLGHTLLWEFVSEAFYEQPSIQDLIVTPISGVILGELIHRGTLRMSRNGFIWYEKALIILINPLYVLNNGFKRKTKEPK